ncbi:hypothetical protein QYE76_020761 [Lolium multiflorum]|uniref:Uncharacterized protein n=1 Tax=Lolium multiflorum TaxID=4521 RepID=A0AAD8VQB1_LOLMU|nr:hypothetical protein QYE76_020761 [Lolium multiflorum]
MKLDGEAIPLSESVELALDNDELDGLVFVEIRWLVLQIPRRVSVIEVLVDVVVVSALDEVVGFTLIVAIIVLVIDVVVILLVIGEAGREFSDEELDVVEVSRSTAQVELPRFWTEGARRDRSVWSERLEVSWRRKKLERIVEPRSIGGLGEVGGLQQAMDGGDASTAVMRRRRGSRGGGERAREGSPARRSSCRARDRARDRRREGAHAGRRIPGRLELVQVQGAEKELMQSAGKKDGYKTLIVGLSVLIEDRH